MDVGAYSSQTTLGPHQRVLTSGSGMIWGHSPFLKGWGAVSCSHALCPSE